MNLVEYELVYLAKPDLEDTAFDEIADRAEGTIGEAQGAVFLRDHWGRKRLAYDIANFNKGHYTLMMFAAPTDIISRIERTLRLDERVMRYMTIRRADSVDLEARTAWGQARTEELRKEREERARIEAERAAEREQAELERAEREAERERERAERAAFEASVIENAPQETTTPSPDSAPQETTTPGPDSAVEVKEVVAEDNKA